MNKTTLTFEEFLRINKQLNKRTTKHYLTIYAEFIAWLTHENLTIEDLRYNDLLAFIQTCLNKGNSKSFVNAKLGLIRHYFDYNILLGKVTDNSATNLHIHGISRRIVHDILAYEKLEEIFANFPTDNLSRKQNKVILGILIYQGVTTHEISLLETKNIDLKKAKIYIPATRKTNSRLLDLQANQIIQMQQFLTKTRPLILALAEKDNDQLFNSIGKSKILNNLLYKLALTVKKYEPKFKNTKQLRSSVITYWIEKHNLREAQYMAGHRYVSSTERYRLSNLDDLKKDVQNFHPF